MNWTYGIAIHEDDGDQVVTVRDLSEVCTSGHTLTEALELAADAVAVVVAWRIKHELDLPQPKPVLKSEYPVPLEPKLAAKASVYSLWRNSKLSKVELARRMGRNEAEVRRLLDPRHGTKLDQLQEAALAMGSRLVVGTVPLVA